MAHRVTSICLAVCAVSLAAAVALSPERVWVASIALVLALVGWVLTRRPPPSRERTTHGDGQR